MSATQTPGYDVAVTVTSRPPPQKVIEIWRGDRSWASAVGDESMRVLATGEVASVAARLVPAVALRLGAATGCRGARAVRSLGLLA